jgi:transglutaminase-like putative cysteine protease
MRVSGGCGKFIFVILVAGALLGLKIDSDNKQMQRHFTLSDELEYVFTNADDVIEELHRGLAAHARSFTITYKAAGDHLGETEQLVDELVNDAMYNTDSPTEGDYVRYQYGGYRLRYGKSDGENGYDYQLVITPVYYSTVEQEQKVDEKVEEILDGLNIGKRASDREKVQAVYDYICGNVKYDYVHKNNSHYHRDSTAYAALVENYASCQGYAVAVFRLLKELGVECTVVTGTGIDEDGNEEFHAWNRVVIDGEAYDLDATWDAGKEEYDYFLVEDEYFLNHIVSSTE